MKVKILIDWCHLPTQDKELGIEEIIQFRPKTDEDDFSPWYGDGENLLFYHSPGNSIIAAPCKARGWFVEDNQNA